MPDIMLNTPVNSGTLTYTEYFFLPSKILIETKSNSSNLFQNILSFGFEPGDSLINYFYTYNCLPLIDNNYLSLFLRKLPYNYRIFSSAGTYINDASSNLIFNLSKPDEIDSENNDSLLEVNLINIKRISEIHAFLILLKEKDDEVNDISGMKDIFLKVDELIDNKEHNLIDELITSFISLDFSFQFHVSLLASTLIIKHFLNNRNKLYANAILIGKSLMSSEDLQLTLQGLEDNASNFVSYRTIQNTSKE